MSSSWGRSRERFTPDDTNIGEWLDNWQVFDQADYNPLIGYFTSDVQMTPDGLSNSAYLSPGATSFEGKAAYLWIRNFDTPSATTEWLLVRASLGYSRWPSRLAVPIACRWSGR